LPQPNKSTADSQHWIYRYDGHRKCWFRAAEGIVTVKKPVHRHAGSRVAAPKENESALRGRKAVVDARTELTPFALAERPPTKSSPAPDLKVVDAAPVPATGAAELLPPVPAITTAATDQLMSEQPTPRQVDVETLLAAAPAASEAVAASAWPPATPIAVHSTEVGDDGGGWKATWLGALLMALGLVSLLSSSRTLRRAFGVARSLLARRLIPRRAARGGRRTEIGTPELCDDAICRALTGAFGRDQQLGLGGVAGVAVVDHGDGLRLDWRELHQFLNLLKDSRVASFREPAATVDGGKEAVFDAS